jgi:hypothetical protein
MKNREKWRLIIQEAKLTLSCCVEVKEGKTLKYIQVLSYI